MKIETTQRVQIKKEELRKLCAKKGISIYRLSQLAGVSYEHLLRLNQGMFSMSYDYWLKIRNILDQQNKNKTYVKNQNPQNPQCENRQANP
jgi:predicted transcriptional regulator